MTTNLELITIDPADLIIDTNVRKVIDLDPLFLESIRDNGVRQPPTAWRDDAGAVHVEIGQRRTLAAVRAGLPEIPVIVKPKAVAQDEREAERQRIIDQLSENDHRSGLTDADHIAAYQELTLFGLTADQIAKSTKTKRDRVRAAVKLASTAPAVTAEMSTRPVTLDQAIIIAEFEDDETIRTELLQVAEENPDDLEFAAQRFRREVAEAAALAAEVEKLEAEGFEYISSEDLLERQDDWEHGYVYIEEVSLSEDDLRHPTVEEARNRGGLLVSIRAWSQWSMENQTLEKQYEREYWIEKPGEHGYVNPDEVEVDIAPEPDDVRAAREAHRAAFEEEEAKEQAWRDASAVRERWIINELLCGKKLPERAMVWISGYMLNATGHTNNHWDVDERAETAARWLGIEVSEQDARKRTPFLAYADNRGGVDSWKLVLAIVLANFECKFRRHMDISYAFVIPHVAAYLEQLEAWGYTLTSTERESVDAAVELAREKAEAAEGSGE